MNIIFRTDASLQIGSGHVMRCLTLADELRQRGADVRFVCREHPGNLIGLIEGKDYPVERLPQAAVEYIASSEDVAHAAWLGVSWQQDALASIAAMEEIQPDWLIIDSYAIDHRWEVQLRSHVGKIMVIDDLADRVHDCDLLLDQNLYQAMETRYDNQIPGDCQKLLGPRYALLRPEFAAARKNLRERDGQVRRVMVFFGGVDPTNETEKALQALFDIRDRQFEVGVVVGGLCPKKEQIQNLCEKHEVLHYHCQIDNMEELMVHADLMIGAGGSTTWERCCLGLPSLILSIAENQVEIAKEVDRRGAACYLGKAEKTSIEAVATALDQLLYHPADVKLMSDKAKCLVDGLGVQRVVKELINQC